VIIWRERKILSAAISTIPFEVAPFRLSGAVYGALLNHRSALEELGEKVSQPPYNAPPRAPVLYIKPRNTLAVSGDTVGIPAGNPELEIGACVGLVIGRAACRLKSEEALQWVAGYLIVNDVSIPHDTFYRPSIRLKAHDGFCPLGPAVVARDAIANPDALVIRTYVDGVLRQESSTADSLRSAARLLADVTEFMTLSAGDVLTLGCARPAPRARSGEVVKITVDGLGSLWNRFAAVEA
jgi:5-oxopent-3-ene-1,2,5-tricarboxylate decarboxylase / 2-hydroxyhepta-2,4-diene-1,7-dioate isomerase